MEMHESFSARGGSALGGKVLANSSNSQINIHIPYGGVFPKLAKLEHERNLPILLEACLKQAKLNKPAHHGEKKSPVDAIMITYGPGLEMSLWTGITFAKELAQKWKVPLVPVNHMEGHILSVFGKEKGTFKIQKLKTPILTLLVSGGHTQLVLSKKPASTKTSLGGWMHYEIIGETLDDAVGEAFDKVARMLDLPYPGGPEISKLAEGVREKENKVFRGRNFSAEKFAQSSVRRPAESPQDLFSFSLPRPMLHSKDFNFSFSGLKTAVLYLIRDLGGIEKINQETKAQIALEFENAAIECLTHKTKKAIEKYNVKTLIVAGGVVANKHLQNEIKIITTARAGQAKNKIKLLLPTKELMGDNSIMIGIAGYLNYIKGKKKVPKLDSIKATGNLRL
jgi:N6-L-threonylcarbamoyladenine synthase